MEVKETFLKGCFVIKPKVFIDERGRFLETFHQEKFNKLMGSKVNFIQDNESQSSKGVLRGLHFQKGKHAQAKLVRVIKGKILDVVVDLRKGSNTFGKHFSIELSCINKKQLFIPRGFAHGFLALEEDTIFSYKCDNFYNTSSEAGINYNDIDLNIDWKFLQQDIILSEKDVSLPSFKEACL